ncbi:MAG: ABC transporter substrate-binding protein [Candidatus Dependentiae bacterium]|nr:ABC transporter substrate-binding protein [Candidatus Dependentiae bacterium]
MKTFLYSCALVCFCFSCAIFLATLLGCARKRGDNVLTFALSADYPPFEYFENGEIVGFDVELAQLLAKELGKQARFVDMQFSSIFAAVQNGGADAAISTIAVTPERQKNFDFSEPYHVQMLATVFRKAVPFAEVSQLVGAKIACQLGTTMELWAKAHVPSADLTLLDLNTQVIEALKAGHVDVALVDAAQAKAFVTKNGGLACACIARSDAGYAILCPKGSGLATQFTQALRKLQQNGELTKLQHKWFEEASWEI